MSKIITRTYLNSIKFYQMPKAFFHNPKYIPMKNESKIAYSILRDLLELSIENNWINDNDEVYVKLSRIKLMQRLNIKGTQKMTEVMNELKNKELIIEKQIGLKKCNEIYICIPEDLNDIYSDDELLDYGDNSITNNENFETFENQKSGVLKIKSPEFRKSKVKTFENQKHTNTNITNTNITNTSSSSILNEFENNICELKKTTKPKFLKLISKSNEDMILAVIEECASTNVRSYKGFEVAFKSYIKRNCKTGEDVKKAAEEYRKTKKSNKTYSKKIKKELNDPSPEKFNNFKPREYDYDELEIKMLGWDKTESDF